MRLSFQNLAPDISARLQSISQFPLIRYVNETVWIFAIVETVHLVFLAVLGGSVLALNLRLLGVALKDVSVQEVERVTRPWLRWGIAGSVVTGIAMGLTTMTTLLGSAAFFVKILALIAAILLSSAVARGVRRPGGKGAPEAPRALAALALALWVASLILFATTTGLGSGAFLVALAGFALFAAVLDRHRRTYLLGLAAILLGGLVASATIDDAWVGPAITFAALFLAAGLGTLELRKGGPARLTPGTISAYASILAWVTVAAAGRWIGFS